MTEHAPPGENAENLRGGRCSVSAGLSGRNRLERTAVGCVTRRFAIRTRNHARVRLWRKLARRFGEQVTIAERKQLRFGLRTPHVVEKCSIRVDALTDEVEILLHLVHVITLGNLRRLRRTIKPLD